MTAEATLSGVPLLLDVSCTGGREPHRPMDEARFERFYRATAGSLWAYLFRLTGDASAADDLLQKAFFNFLRSKPAFVSDEHMKRYLFRAATNLAFDHFREKKRHASRPLDEVRTAGSPDKGDLRLDMMRIFSELKPRERALLWLAHVEESNHEEIGEALGLKAKSIKVLLFRARKKLGELLTRRGIGPEVLP
jgi:RNA polymerase sigma-70 factor (ECF subfamily)